MLRPQRKEKDKALEKFHVQQSTSQTTFSGRGLLNKNVPSSSRGPAEEQIAREEFPIPPPLRERITMGRGLLTVKKLFHIND
jgi:hypothetical protein